jgi:hypothetical protein
MSSQFEGAKITEHGVTFGIVIVKPHVLHNAHNQAGARALGTRAFGRIPIVLWPRTAGAFRPTRDARTLFGS